MKPDNTTVFSFPQKVPEKAVTRHDMAAVEQLRLGLLISATGVNTNRLLL